MRRIVLLCLLVAGLTASAHADSIPFSFTSSSGTLSGIFYVTKISTDQYQVTGATGAGIAGITSYNGSDNLLFLAPTYSHLVDALGIAIALSGTPNKTDLTYVSGYHATYPPSQTVVNGTLTVGAVTITPEPSSLILLGTGLLGGVAAMRRRMLAR